jgi:hypothetical protein
MSIRRDGAWPCAIASVSNSGLPDARCEACQCVEDTRRSGGRLRTVLPRVECTTIRPSCSRALSAARAVWRLTPYLLASSGSDGNRAPGPYVPSSILTRRSSVPFPDLIAPDLREHLDRLGQDAALLFTSPDGQPLRHSNFYRRAWMPALTATGLVGIHLHDLRHSGNQFIADAGANPRELMARMATTALAQH